MAFSQKTRAKLRRQENYTGLLSMKRLSKLSLFSLIACSIFISYSAYAENSLFRYTNDQGGRVISDSIPPYYAAKGYEIIDSRGTVIKTVPRELSAEEKIIQEQQRKEQARLDKWDKELRSRYRHVDDIKTAKKRRLTDIDNSLDSLRLTLENISETIKNYQAEAASNERQGEAIPKETLSSLSRLQKDRDFIVQETANREKQRQEIISSYEKDIERFKLISMP